jgi:hypothetical protein
MNPRKKKKTPSEVSFFLLFWQIFLLTKRFVRDIIILRNEGRTFSQPSGVSPPTNPGRGKPTAICYKSGYPVPLSRDLKSDTNHPKTISFARAGLQ